MRSSIPKGYQYQVSGRNQRTGVVLVAVFFALIVARLWLNLSGWIIAGLVIFMVPAMWDLWSARLSGVRMDAYSLSWYSGKRRGDALLSEIALVRFDTRLDMSIRVTLVMGNGKKIRLPYDVLPPHIDFETALHAHNVKTERHHFALMQG